MKNTNTIGNLRDLIKKEQLSATKSFFTCLELKRRNKKLEEALEKAMEALDLLLDGAWNSEGKFDEAYDMREEINSLLENEDT